MILVVYGTKLLDEVGVIADAEVISDEVVDIEVADSKIVAELILVDASYKAKPFGHPITYPFSPGRLTVYACS